MTARRPEQALQRAIAQFLMMALPPEIVWSAIGHGGGGKIRGAILKAMGLRAGLGDIVIFYRERDVQPPRSSTLWLELKSDRGRQSPEQITFMNEVQQLGHYYRLCRSINDVSETLRHYGVPTRATVNL